MLTRSCVQMQFGDRCSLVTRANRALSVGLMRGAMLQKQAEAITESFTAAVSGNDDLVRTATIENLAAW